MITNRNPVDVILIQIMWLDGLSCCKSMFHAKVDTIVDLKNSTFSNQREFRLNVNGSG